MSLFYQIYSLLWRWLIPSRSNWQKALELEPKNTIWFHAASAGELEVLIPLIEASVSKGRSTCVSIFSPSAESWLKRLPQALLYAGFSPREGDWQAAFQHYGVTEVVTSKYEAWPGLWSGASLQGVRITVVCAQMRSSLTWAKRLLWAFGIVVPRLRFFVLEESAIPALKENFQDAECILSVDPRWLRVSVRAKLAKDSVTLQKWVKKYEDRPRPYWVMGSVWPEDMEFLKDEIARFPGTIWVAPHALKPAPNASLYAAHPNQILVDEMGLLVELYSIADRVWVGGGFAPEKNRGIHSTLEPAVYSVPIGCGAKNTEKFFETKELQEKNILTICRTEKDLRNWMENTPSVKTVDLDSKVKAIAQLIETIL